ncbi:hypothetical protein ACA910_019356 [Epithemia clementina (nom. ined.)]
MEESNDVFTAVPLLAEHQENDRKEVVVPKTLNSRDFRVTPFLSGASIGVLFSVLGFRILLAYQGDNSYKNIFLFALIWSTVTSTAAYAVFGMAWSYMMSVYSEIPQVYASLVDEDFLADMEYYFALGVFIGFCAACTVSDIIYGLPWTGVMLTVAVAFLWTLVMTWFASRGRDERRGTVLPLVMV